MRPDRVTLAALGVVVVLAGSNLIAMRVSNRELSPAWGAAIRFLAASVILWAVVAVRGLPLPRGRALLGALLFGVLGTGMGQALSYTAMVEVPAGLASIVFALIPLITLVLASVQGVESFRWRALAGALLALMGITVASSGAPAVGASTTSMLLLVAAAACIAESYVVTKWLPPGHPIPTAAISTGIGAALLFALSTLGGESQVLPRLRETWAALIFLVLCGSVAFVVLSLFVLRRWSASAMAYSPVLAPFVTLTIAASFGEEPTTLVIVLGGALVLAGVWLGALTGTLRSSGTAPPTPQA